MSSLPPSGKERTAADADAAELRAEHLVAGNLEAGIRLWAGVTVFFFLGPFFAYVYLRSLNTADLWRPSGIDPPQALGAAVVIATIASAVALVLAARAVSTPRPRWLALGVLSLALGVAAVVLQIVQYWQLSFGPTDGGYASVFVAWTGLTALFTLGTMLSLEMLLAYGLRARRRPAGEAAEADPAPRLAALAFYWPFLAGLAVVMWVVLYLL